MSNERDELADVIESGYGDDPTDCPYDHAPTIADIILAAGYRKPRTITQWGASFVHNGAFYKSYDTRESAQAFVDDMGEVGAHLVVVTREHTPAVDGEWVTT